MKPERSKKSWKFFKLNWRQNHEHDESDAK